MIQDFEPLLYNASSNYALAMETYSLDYLPIFNTSYLRDHFIADRVGRFSDPDFAKQSLFFDPAVDCSRFYPNPAAKAANGKKRLLFYTRPNAERNLLELGVAALMKIIADQSIDPSEWDFFSTLTGVGGNCRPVELSASPSVTLTPLPLLDLDTWAAEMQRADVVLSMVLSPHHGYALLEAVACGATVVTNTWSVKTQERLKDLSPQIIAGSPTIEGIAGTLVEAMTQQPSTEDNPPSLSYPSSWEDSWRPLVPELLDFFASCGIRPS